MIFYILTKEAQKLRLQLFEVREKSTYNNWFRFVSFHLCSDNGEYQITFKQMIEISISIHARWMVMKINDAALFVVKLLVKLIIFAGESGWPLSC